MKIVAFSFFIIASAILSCTPTEEPLVCHLYGYARSAADSTTGINNLILQIKDMDPYDISTARIRETTTRANDTLDGFFEMDSVCYGTTNSQGTGYVVIHLDSVQNNSPWPDHYWAPTILGEVDTIVVYVSD